jgi:hypothetical protein
MGCGYGFFQIPLPNVRFDDGDFFIRLYDKFLEQLIVLSLIDLKNAHCY